MEPRIRTVSTLHDGPVIGTLGRAVQTIRSSVTCDEVDGRFRRDDTLRCLVAGEEEGRLGLVARTDFQQRMAGPLGFGRVLFGRRRVAELADWDPVVVSEHALIAVVAEQVLERQDRHPVSDVLVVTADATMLHVPVRELFQALAGQYAERAVTDPLTGLANRERFLDRLHRCCELVNAGAGQVAVLYIDLDRFKAINDSLGHQAGDEALRTVADRLRACFRAEDVVARLGGDEFAVVMQLEGGSRPASQVPEALAARVLSALSRPMQLHGATVDGRASLGLAISGEEEADSETLLREADFAMYRAKAAGGGAVDVVAEVRGALSPAARAGQADAGGLRRALAERQFVLHYQPIVHVHTGRLASVEALARWVHPEKGLLGPAEFLPGIDAVGLGVEFGAYVLRSACAQLQSWRQTLGADAPHRVNVNLSVAQLLDGSLLATVLDALNEHDLNPEALRLELPEVATVAQMQQARPALAELRSVGVAVTLDDLGAGASSLTHLTQVALDGIKIDRQFVSGMLDDDRDMAVVRMLLEMANAMGLAVTAEGVETPEQLAALGQLSTGRSAYLQGYLICRPAPAAELPLPWADGLEPVLSRLPKIKHRLG